MRLIFVVTVLAFFQAAPPLSRKAADNPASTTHARKNQSETKNEPSAPSAAPLDPAEAPKGNDSAKDGKREDAQKPVRIRELPPVTVAKDWTDRLYGVSSLLLVIVGFLGIWVANRTLKVIARQAVSMRRQTRILRKSVAVAEENARAAEAGVDAARTGAEAASANAIAARDSVEMLISKERARIRVELIDLNLNPKLVFSNTYSVLFKVCLYGSTEAFIVSSESFACISDSQQPSDHFLYPLTLPSVVSPTNRVVEGSVFIFPLQLSQEDITAIEQGREFVHFQGFIKYRDVFDRERETRFRFCWSVTEFKTSDGRHISYHGCWHRCGQESDNSET